MSHLLFFFSESLEVRASLACYLNQLPILYLGSGGQKNVSSKLPIRLPIFVGPINFPFD